MAVIDTQEETQKKANEREKRVGALNRYPPPTPALMRERGTLQHWQ